jgi:hypothetical protein
MTTEYRLQRVKYVRGTGTPKKKKDSGAKHVLAVRKANTWNSQEVHILCTFICLFQSSTHPNRITDKHKPGRWDSEFIPTEGKNLWTFLILTNHSTTAIPSKCLETAILLSHADKGRLDL